MKLLLPFFTSFVLLVSCQTYQYLNISGKDIKQDSSYQFYAENDTLLLRYNFNGYNGPVKVSVYNKSNQPLFIDWKRSAVIIHEKAYSFYSPNLQLSGTAVTSSVNWNNGISMGSGSLSADIKGQEGVDFIPPKSSKEKTSLYLLNGVLENIPVSQMKRQFPDGDATMPKLKTIEYSEESSPFRLRTYLTLYAEGATTQPFVMEHRFYVSKIQEGLAGPGNLGNYLNRGDRFYSSTINGFGKTAGVVSVLGIAAGSAAIVSNNQQ